MSNSCPTEIGTPEIIENILVHLDMRTLLLAQRVSHQWQEIINNSPSLQRKLFLLPCPYSEAKTKNPLLCELFPQWFAHGEWAINSGFGTKDLNLINQARNGIIEARPLPRDVPPIQQPIPERSTTRFSKTFGRVKDRLNRAFLGRPASQRPVNGPTGAVTGQVNHGNHRVISQNDLESISLVSVDRNDDFIYENASWRRMFITQPPIYSFLKYGCASIPMIGLGGGISKLTSEGETYLSDGGNNTDELPEDTSDPISMERFYQLVTGDWGESHHWMFIWKDLGDLNPEAVNYDVDIPNVDKNLHKGMMRDGVIMFIRKTNQCDHCDEYGPWRFRKEFHLKYAPPS